MSLAVGIDLGTTNCCVAVYQNGEVNIIENEEQESTIPSFVYYHDDSVIVGKEAEHRSALNPSNGIFDSKRMLGHKFDDKEIQENLTKWPFTVTRSVTGEPQIEVEQDGEAITIRPEEVSAQILVNLKRSACIELDRDITDAVITVPAYFTNAQRQATMDAAKLAGLNVLKLINEPTAAALNFISLEESKKRTVLVYDLGGGTFDVSLIKFDKATQGTEGVVLSVSGDSYLGGRDFDNNLLSYFLDEMEKMYGINLRDSETDNRTKGNIRRVRSYCEQIKKTLSESYKTAFILDAFLGHDVNIPITREQFEGLNERLFAKTIEIVNQAIVNANIDIKEIDDVVLVGGSTRIPKIQQLVTDYFGGRTLNKSVNPDEAVAGGAAIQASLLSGSAVEETDNYYLVDVTSFSLGIEVVGKMVSTIIRRNTEIPVSFRRTYRTSRDNQTTVKICVYEGENKYVSDNIKLGEFDIKGITPLARGEVRVDVIFEMDLNGMLNVKATESSKNVTKDLSIDLHSMRLTEENFQAIAARISNNNDHS